MDLQTKNFIRPLIGAAIILAIPALCMIFSVDGWMWSAMDFLIMGTLLYVGGLTYEFFALKARTPGQRGLIAIAVLCFVLVIWAQLAVQAVSQLIGFSN